MSFLVCWLADDVLCCLNVLPLSHWHVGTPPSGYPGVLMTLRCWLTRCLSCGHIVMLTYCTIATLMHCPHCLTAVLTYPILRCNSAPELSEPTLSLSLIHI